MMRALGVVALLTLAFAGSAGAYHPHNACVQTETRHGYVGSAGFVGQDGFVLGDGAGGGYKPRVVDGCGWHLVGDGEYEFGHGGAALAAGPCITDPFAWEHHIWGPGAGYWAEEHSGGSVAYVAATDGPLWWGGCETNGIISSDPIIDAYDCVGSLGVYAPSIWWPTFLVENVDGNGCTPGDGYVWVFTLSGTVIGGAGVFVSTPVSGHIWDAGWGWGGGEFIFGDP